MVHRQAGHLRNIIQTYVFVVIADHVVPCQRQTPEYLRFRGTVQKFKGIFPSDDLRMVEAIKIDEAMVQVLI
ncbi:hypothetical protein D3C80_2138320 [compost metagenome]